MFDRYACDLDFTKQLAGCNLYTRVRGTVPCIVKSVFLLTVLYKEISSHVRRSSVSFSIMCEKPTCKFEIAVLIDNTNLLTT